jgi:carbon monoxide dehydrogenase subunit G
MHYEGYIDAPVSKKEFYEFITEPKKVIEILPDVVESRITDRDHFAVKAKAGIAHLRGTLEIRFEVVERKEGSRAKISGHGQGMQSSVEMTMEIVLEEAPQGSRARWNADVQVGGLLASVAGRLLDGVAAKYVRQITENLKREVSS